MVRFVAITHSLTRRAQLAIVSLFAAVPSITPFSTATSIGFVKCTANPAACVRSRSFCSRTR